MPSLLRLFNLRERDRAPLRAFAPVFGLVTATNVVLISFAKSLFISNNEAAALPSMYIAASIFAAVAAVAYVGLTGRTSHARRFDVLLLLAVGSFSLLGMAIELNPPLVSLIIYAWSTGIGQLLVIQTWAYTTTALPTRSARRLFPVFAAAATLGAALGGAITRGLLPLMGLSGLIHVAVALLVVTFFMMRRAVSQLDAFTAAELAAAQNASERAESVPVATAPPPPREPVSARVARIREAFGYLGRFPLLTSIAALAFLTQVASVTLDFQFSAALKVHYSGDEMAGFFGVYYALANLMSLLVALLGGSRLTRSIGIGIASAAAAAMLMLGGAAASALFAGGITTLLWPVVATSFGERVLAFGVSKPALQAAFTPLDPKVVESGKFVIDGVVHRLATLSVSVALYIAMYCGWLDLRDYGQLSPVVMVAALVAIFFGIRLGRHYRDTLFSGLRERRVATDDASTAPWAERDARTVVRTLLATGVREDVAQGLALSRELRLAPPRPLVRSLSAHDDPRVVIDLMRTLTVLDLPPSADIVTAVLARYGGDETADDDAAAAYVLRATLRALPRGEQAVDAGFEALVPVIEPFTHHRDAAVAALAFVWLRANASEVVGATRLLTYELRLMRDLASKDRATAIGAVEQVAALGRAEYVPPLLDALISPGLRPAVLTALEQLPRAPVFAEVSRRLAGDSGLSDAERVWLLRLAEDMGGDQAVALIAPYVDARSHVVKDQATRSLWRLAKRGFVPHKELLRDRAATEVDALVRLALFDGMVRRTAPVTSRTALLRREVALRRARGERRAFRLLGLLYGRAAFERAFLGYRDADPRVRSNAIELLDTTIDDPELRDFVAYVEASERRGGVTRTTLGSSKGLMQRFARLLGETDPTAGAEATVKMLGTAPGTKEWLESLFHWALRADDATHADTDDERWARLELLTRVELFDRVPAQDLEPIAALALPAQFRAGEVLFCEGDAADDLYLIVEGEVDVVSAERGRMAVLGSGECVGEMGVLDGAPRSATVTALSPVKALRIERPDFEDLLELFPAVSRGIIDVLTQRLRRTQASGAATRQAA